MSVLKSLSTLILALALDCRDSGQVPKAAGTEGCLRLPRTGREPRPLLHFPLRFPCSQLPHLHYYEPCHTLLINSAKFSLVFLRQKAVS